jgi:hypothetical protein
LRQAYDYWQDQPGSRLSLYPGPGSGSQTILPASGRTASSEVSRAYDLGCGTSSRRPQVCRAFSRVPTAPSPTCGFRAEALRTGCPGFRTHEVVGPTALHTLPSIQVWIKRKVPGLRLEPPSCFIPSLRMAYLHKHLNRAPQGRPSARRRLLCNSGGYRTILGPPYSLIACGRRPWLRQYSLVPQQPSPVRFRGSLSTELPPGLP